MSFRRRRTRAQRTRGSRRRPRAARRSARRSRGNARQRSSSAAREGLALGALRDQSDALGAHRSSLTQRAGPASRNSVRLGSSPRAPTRVGGLRASAGVLAAGPVQPDYSFGVWLAARGPLPARKKQTASASAWVAAPVLALRGCDWPISRSLADAAIAASDSSRARASVRGELRLRTLRAVEDKLGRLLDVLIDAEVGVPALRVRRQPHGPAFRALRDQRDALERHAASLGRRRRPDYSLFQDMRRRALPLAAVLPV